MNFATAAKETSKLTLTENGAVAYNTTDNVLLDLFGIIGAMRTRTEAEIIEKFSLAFNKDPLLATKMAFYCGNIRGGLGERRTFRICLKWLANNHPQIVIKNLACISHFNRWDSLFTLVGTPVEKQMWEYIMMVLNNDVNNLLVAQKTNTDAHISLLAKWMPSENASSKETKALARKAIHKLYLTPKAYRQLLTTLRSQLNIVETKMSAKEWDTIAYATVPSYAMKNYRNAFKKHDLERFNKYVESLATGETKINASTLYPYDIVRGYVPSSYLYSTRAKTEDPVLEAQWKALPNYVEGENNIIVMADVSGSMWGTPMQSSVGLATYFAQRNSGEYKNLYMTFTNKPHFISLKDEDSLANCVNKVMKTDVGYGTDLNEAFNYILDTAIANEVSSDELPKALVVISDMEINPYFNGNRNFDFLQTQRAKFANAGYQLPKLILWNVESRHDTYLAKSNDVILVSGQSASSFKNIINNINSDAYTMMLNTLNDTMYECITI